MSGFSTVAHNVENLYGFLCKRGESGSGVGRSTDCFWACPCLSVGADMVVVGMQERLRRHAAFRGLKGHEFVNKLLFLC